MRPGPCAHCGSHDRSRQCRYAWWLPYAADWKKSGADAPCYGDDYAADLIEQDNARNWHVAAIIGSVAIVGGFFYWLLHL